MSTKTPTKAPVPKPARAAPPRMSFLGSAPPPAPNRAADNMQAVKLQDMSFKVDPAFHRRFKATASLHGISMKDLLEQSFALWEEANKEPK